MRGLGKLGPDLSTWLQRMDDDFAATGTYKTPAEIVDSILAGCRENKLQQVKRELGQQVSITQLSFMYIWIIMSFSSAAFETDG